VGASVLVAAVAAQPAWQSLFDGKTLAGWKSTEFGGEGRVSAEGGTIILGRGDPLTGVTYSGDIPRIDYEIALQAMKLDGNDFFCALTFPIADRSCSLILGGWGGTIVGLSSLDGLDASENETTQSLVFDKDRWYDVRVRVTPGSIEAWLDEKPIVAVSTKGRHIGIRPEVDLSRPLGIASYRTRAALRNIRIRPVG
jgi:hypothetical protein